MRKKIIRLAGPFGPQPVHQTRVIHPLHPVRLTDTFSSHTVNEEATNENLTCANTSAIIGMLVRMANHGVGGKSSLRFSWPISACRYSRSSFEMNGCEPGSL